MGKKQTKAKKKEQPVAKRRAVLKNLKWHLSERMLEKIEHYRYRMECFCFRIKVVVRLKLVIHYLVRVQITLMNQFRNNQATLPSRPPAQTKKSSIPPRNLRYPVNEEIHNTTDYLKIDIVEYKPVAKNNNGSLVSSPGSRRANGKNILHSIILPIPPNIQDGNAVSYSDSSMNALTALLPVRATDIMTELPKAFGPKGNLNILKDKLGDRIEQSGLDLGTAQDLITKQLAAQAGSVFGGNVSLRSITLLDKRVIFSIQTWNFYLMVQL